MWHTNTEQHWSLLLESGGFKGHSKEVWVKLDDCDFKQSLRSFSFLTTCILHFKTPPPLPPPMCLSATVLLQCFIYLSDLSSPNRHQDKKWRLRIKRTVLQKKKKIHFLFFCACKKWLPWQQLCFSQELFLSISARYCWSLGLLAIKAHEKENKNKDVPSYRPAPVGVGLDYFRPTLVCRVQQLQFVTNLVCYITFLINCLSCLSWTVRPAASSEGIHNHQASALKPLIRLCAYTPASCSKWNIQVLIIK